MILVNNKKKYLFSF